MNSHISAVLYWYSGNCVTVELYCVVTMLDVILCFTVLYHGGIVLYCYYGGCIVSQKFIL